MSFCEPQSTTALEASQCFSKRICVAFMLVATLELRP